MSGSAVFKKAVKSDALLRLGLIGPPGSGKTYSALRVGTALRRKGKPKPRVALIDTERRSASKYADLFEFETAPLEGSFHPDRYVELIHAAEEARFDVLIIDSLSHAWIGTDGGLDLHDKAVARQKSKNPFIAWAEVTPHHNRLVQALVQCKCDLLVTLRSKVDYVQEKDEQGRTTVRKIGTAPLMRDGLEYEFDVVGDLDDATRLVVSKTRCPALKRAVVPEPGEALARQLLEWLEAGAPREEEASPTVVTGPALLRRVTAKDAHLAAEGLAPAGGLLAAVVQAGEARGLGCQIGEWPPEGFQLAVEVTRSYEARCREAQSNGHGA